MGKTLVSVLGSCLLCWQLSTLRFSLFLGPTFLFELGFFSFDSLMCLQDTDYCQILGDSGVTRRHCTVTGLDAVLSICFLFSAFFDKPC